MQSQTGNSRKIIAIAVISAIGIAIVASLIVVALVFSTNPGESGAATESASNLESLSNRLDSLESRINSLSTETVVVKLPPATATRAANPDANAYKHAYGQVEFAYS